MPVANTISDIWCRFQEELFPALTEILGPLSDRHRKLVTVLEFATPEALLPAESRRALPIDHLATRQSPVCLP